MNVRRTDVQYATVAVTTRGLSCDVGSCFGSLIQPTRMKKWKNGTENEVNSQVQLEERERNINGQQRVVRGTEKVCVLRSGRLMASDRSSSEPRISSASLICLPLSLFLHFNLFVCCRIL